MKQILIKPIITEKSMREASKGKFTFEVDSSSNKMEISRSVSEAFKVEPMAVQTITIPSRTKRAGKKRLQFKSPPRKKAIITLIPGQKIDLFDVTEGDHPHA